MGLLLTGRQVEITPALRKLVDARLLRLHRLLGDSIVSVQVVLSREKYRYRAEITLHARGDHVLHGLGKTASWSASLTSAVEKLMQQAQKVKGKWKERKRRASPAKALPAAPVQEPSLRRRIVRVGRYPVKPMTLEEAALQAEGREFVVFRNASTDAINVLYRRVNGELGLIEPEA